MPSRRIFKEAERFNELLENLVVEAIRVGVTEGFEEAVHRTHQDSSNAAAHWMVGITGKSIPRNRKYGHVRDDRNTGNALIGKRGEDRSNSRPGLATQVADAIVQREMATVIAKYIRGHKPATKIYFYNAVMDIDPYQKRAGIEEAGKAGVERAIAAFRRQAQLPSNRLLRPRNLR